MLQNANVLVTGGAGFIGSHVVDELLFHDVSKIKVVDDLSRGSLTNLMDARKGSRVEFERRIIGDYSVPLKYECGDVLIHMAAKVSSIDYNRKNQSSMFWKNMEINTGIFRNVYNGNIKTRLLVYVSTACIYPHDAPVPTPEWCGEQCNPEPTNYGYGLAKWIGEKQAQLIHDDLRIPTLIVRFFNAVGTRDYYDDETSHVVPALIKRLHLLGPDEPLAVWGTGEQTRVFVDARDIAKVLCKLIEQPKAHDGSPVNIGHTDELSIESLACMLMNTTGITREVSFDTSKPDGYSRRAADVNYMNSLIGEHEFIPLHETLGDMVLDYKQRCVLEEDDA